MIRYLVLAYTCFPHVFSSHSLMMVHSNDQYLIIMFEHSGGCILQLKADCSMLDWTTNVSTYKGILLHYGSTVAICYKVNVGRRTSGILRVAYGNGVEIRRWCMGRR